MTDDIHGPIHQLFQMRNRRKLTSAFSFFRVRA